MPLLRSVFRKTLGLFVDDRGFALAILIWLAAACLLAGQIAAMRPWSGPILFVGLAAILIASAMRRASGRAQAAEPKHLRNP